MKNIKKVVGNNLKYYRFQSGLSQEKFYEKFGLNPKYMACVERGEINVSIEFLNNLSAVLEVEITDFFNESESRIVESKRIDSKKRQEV